MEPEEVVARLRAAKSAGKTLDEALTTFEGAGCTLITLVKAVRDTYAVTLAEASDALDRVHPRFDQFVRKRRTGE